MAKTKHTNFKRRDNIRMPSQRASPFLALPGEIRAMIYRACLVKPGAIDLWPHTFVENQDTIPELVARTKKLAFRKPHRVAFLYFRHQKDLEHVRKQMAVALLRTCRQVWNEAAHLFWRENVWRFSTDRGWEAIRRFLTTVGERPRSMIKHLEIIAPIFCDVTHGDPLTFDSERTLPASAACKNHPKLRMLKGDGNMNLVMDLLKREWSTASKNIRFLIPDGWTLDERTFTNNVMMQNAWAQLRQELMTSQDDITHFMELADTPWLKKVLVIKRGGELRGSNYIQLLHSEGVDVIVEKGAKISIQSGPNGSDSTGEVEVDQIFPAPVHQYENVVGVSRLFEPESNVLPGNGGKATKHQAQRSQSRKLRGFGGCRFARHVGLFCNHCGHKSPRQTLDSFGFPLHPSPQKCPVQWPLLSPEDQLKFEDKDSSHWPYGGRCVWWYVDCVGYKNTARAAKHGFVQEAFTGRRWQ